MTVNQERIFSRLKELGEIGKQEDGIYCMALSEEDNQAYELVRRYMEEAGMKVSTDAAGNLIGRKEGKNPKAPAVMTGSHIDTVYGGGIFDGRLGVIGGIEAVQTMNEQGIETESPIEVVAYRDEEGTRFMGSYSGARFRTGRPLAGILDHVDKDGISVREALRSCGIDPENVHQAALPAGYGKAHLELHIEQGAVLESKDLAVGIVTGICTQIRGEYTITGQSAHAGTTPIALRKDALCAASEAVLAIEEETAASDQCVATVGRIAAEPGGVNIVPGRVKFSLDIRHQDPDVRDELLERINKRIDEICKRRKVSWDLNVMSLETAGKPCSPDVQDVIANACEEAGYPVYRMASGAGHDSGAFVNFCPMGMIFIRSKDGLSHNGAEYSSPEDCAAGVEVLYRSMLKLAKN
ncbi:Zn-dependent hydrolase [Clostridium sp. AM58-1XD]|uniref:Zn-dependent hydrolase n=1 Tax=Clostridium sp. AM58-1XD TaxID=2292307 RepID=UPI000E529B73|nr:Zn-dependent hydrolase [Clostridium sp. AM58-1XD]RGY95850.1 Zn-dependent hydrolase [Clostridium sp. AM58-1XD]